jgi:hypothetical protein
VASCCRVRAMSTAMVKTSEGMAGLETERMNLFTAVNGTCVCVSEGVKE